jgi:hypothetical protein
MTGLYGEKIVDAISLQGDKSLKGSSQIIKAFIIARGIPAPQAASPSFNQSTIVPACDSTKPD